MTTRTVAHEHLRASLRVVTCECHGMVRCPSRAMDQRARDNEGVIPPDYAPESFGIEKWSVFELFVWTLGTATLLLTVYSAVQLFIQWLTA